MSKRYFEVSAKHMKNFGIEGPRVFEVIEVETNMIGGKGFDAFLTLDTPAMLEDCFIGKNLVVAVARGRFVDAPVTEDGVLVEVGFGNAEPHHVGDGAYTVEVAIGGGNFAYHKGPGKFPYFTLQQARAVASAVNKVGAINIAHWTDGYLNPLRADQVAPRPKFQFA